jgi:transposase
MALAQSSFYLEQVSMTQTHSKSRQQAEIAFSQTQTQFFAKDHAVEELDFIVHAREAKTLRLREARIAKELEARTSATSALIKKRASSAG